MKTVLCHGVFDLLHPGHLDHLHQAADMGDYLVVSITADEFIHKGPGRPVFHQEDRKRMLEALRMVDKVMIVEASSAIPAIESIRPALYVKGEDYLSEDKAGNLQQEREAIEQCGGRLVYTTGKPMSSTEIINRNLLGEKVHAFLERIRDKYSVKDIMAWIEKASELDVLVVGEPITDEYVYVRPGFKSPKENIITYIQEQVENFVGGTGVVVKHLREFCKSAQECDGLEPVIKRRYVVRPFTQKVFSVAEINDGFQTLAWNVFDRTNSLIVCDYGHGLIPDSNTAGMISREASWLALTVQSNSLNWGFNLLTKWPRADYVVIDEMELRLACSDTETSLEELVEHQANRMGTTLFAVTLGHRGCLVWNGREHLYAPALADKVVDRMGAGDAFLAWTAPLVKLGASEDVVAFIGNIAGAIEVGILGHSEPVRKDMMVRWIENLLA